jgi:hypothetical protein
MGISVGVNIFGCPAKALACALLMLAIISWEKVERVASHPDEAVLVGPQRYGKVRYLVVSWRDQAAQKTRVIRGSLVEDPALALEDQHVGAVRASGESTQRIGEIRHLEL